MENGQTIGQWLKWDFKTNGDLIIRDKNGRAIYYEDKADWAKREWDSQGNQIYFENSNGYIIDNRIPEIIEHTNGHKYQLIK